MLIIWWWWWWWWWWWSIIIISSADYIPRWLACTQSPIYVLPGLGVNQLCWSRPTLYRYNGLSQQYLADDCQLITTTGRRRLQPSNVATCDIPWTRTSLCDRSFTAAGLHLWNNLPLHLRDFELLPVTENAFVWLKITALSDLLLDVVRLTDVLTYLL